MAKVIGSVDDLGRPVVRIEVPDRDGFHAVVDTGFNRSLLLLISEAQAMGFVVTEDAETVELGTAVKTKVLRARALAKMVVLQQSDYASDGWMAEPETMAVRNDSWHTQDASAISKLITRASRSGAVAMRLLFGVGMPGVTNGRFFQKVDPFTRRF